MPVIDLPEEPPIEHANTIAFPVMATMLYPGPHQDEQRLHWFAAAMAGGYNFWRDTGAPATVLADFHGWIGVLWEFRQAPKRVWQDGMRRVPRATLAGHLLLYLLSAARHHPRHCKVERAKALVVEFSAERQVSESLVEKAWAEFKPAAHLWAAMTTRSDLLHDEEGESNAAWLEFLGVAEAYRRASEENRLLRQEETWEAPPDHDIPTQGVEIKPLSDDQLGFLDREFPT